MVVLGVTYHGSVGASKRFLIKAASLTCHCKVVYDDRVRVWIGATFLAIGLAACSQSNNVLLGRVQAQVGTHTVVVTDCYRTSAPGPVSTADGFHYMPCRDADIWIRAEELTVNGKPYGHLNPGDNVLVDHGVVSVDRKPG